MNKLCLLFIISALRNGSAVSRNAARDQRSSFKCQSYHYSHVIKDVVETIAVKFTPSWGPCLSGGSIILFLPNCTCVSQLRRPQLHMAHAWLASVLWATGTQQEEAGILREHLSFLFKLLPVRSSLKASTEFWSLFKTSSCSDVYENHPAIQSMQSFSELRQEPLKLLWLHQAQSFQQPPSGHASWCLKLGFQRSIQKKIFPPSAESLARWVPWGQGHS